MERWSAGSALIGLGIVLLLAAGGIAGYAAYAEWQHTARAVPGPREVLPAQVVVAPSRRDAEPPPTPAVTPIAVGRLPTVVLPPSTVARDREPRPATPVSPPTPTRPAPPMGSRDWVLRVPTPTVRATATPVQQPAAPPPRVAKPELTPPAPPPAPKPAPTPEPAPPALLEYSQPTWITIPKIGVSVNVKQVGVQDGVYVVPAWDVGHHEDSPNPGEPGNAVMNGHLETINAGHIFARLKDLKAGDAVYSYTSTQRLTWAVRESLTVPNTDREFLGPTSDRRLTLYTCTGTFNPITRDYSHRLVVVAALAETTARTVTGR